MADDTSVGLITLDLIIKEKLNEQLENIKSNISASLSKPMDEASKAAEKAAKKAADSWKSAADEQADSIKKLAKEAADRYANMHKTTTSAASKPIEVPIKYSSYDSDKIMDEVDEITEKISNKSKEAAEVIEDIADYKIPTSPIERLNAQIELSREKIESLQQVYKETMSKFSSAETDAEAEKISAALNKIEGQMLSQQNTIDRYHYRIQSVVDKAKKAADTTASNVQKAAERTSSNVKSASSRIIKWQKQSAQTSVAAHEKSQENIRRSVGKTSTVFSRFFRSIKTAARRVFLMAGILSALKGIRSALANAATENKEFAKSLNEVKANLAVAFTPIMQTIMPYLNSLMQGLASVTKAVASFISGLFGTTYKKSLEATKAVKQTAKEAKKAAKEQETYLADFDVVRVQQDQSSASDDAAVTEENSGIDFDALDHKGNKWAENLGKTLRKYLTSAFDKIKKKGAEVFSYLSKWSQKSFAPTFKGIFDGLVRESLQLGETLSGIWTDIQTLAEPLKTYFSGDFTTYLHTVFTTLGNIAVGLFDTFNMVFSDLWNVAVFPILQKFVTDGLPIITQFATEMWSTTDTAFAAIKELFDTYWNDYWVPILDLVAGIVSDLFEDIHSFWDKWGKPIFDGIREAIENTKDIILDLWETVISPVIDHVVDGLHRIWDEHLRPLVQEFLDFVGVLADGALRIYNEFIAPIVSWLIEKLGPIFVKVFNAIWDKVEIVFSGIIDLVKDVIKVFKGIIKFITGVFTGDWEKAWEGIKDIFGGIWDALVDIIKTPLNLIISAVNKMLEAIEDAVNWVIDGINTLSFDVPDWVPGIGGETFGFDLDHIDIPEIPKLATGGLVSAPTLAMVGDNRNASVDPEVVSPLSKLQGLIDNGKLEEVARLLREILEYLKTIDFTFFGTVEGKVLFRFIQDMNDQYKKKTGVSAF
ncbi:MAG: hypothetical protein IJ555_00500 [Ruminococcus sp.]|nr:hypothetical protein [Ruminococcus sp.]